jgi:hypothetical protein
MEYCSWVGFDMIVVAISIDCNVCRAQVCLGPTNGIDSTQ